MELPLTYPRLTTLLMGEDGLYYAAMDNGNLLILSIEHEDMLRFNPTLDMVLAPKIMDFIDNETLYG